MLTTTYFKWEWVYISGLEPWPQGRVEGVALISGYGETKGDDPEVFANPNKIPGIHFLLTVFLEKLAWFLYKIYTKIILLIINAYYLNAV